MPAFIRLIEDAFSADCFWMTLTVNIYGACDSSNLETLHILEINHVVINY